MIMQQDVDQALRSLHDGRFSRTSLSRHFSREDFIECVSVAFDNAGDDTELRDIIFACDIDAPRSRADVAKARNIGLRTLYRRRRAALTKITDYLNERLCLAEAFAEPLRLLQASQALSSVTTSDSPKFFAHCQKHHRCRDKGDLALLEDNYSLAVRYRWSLSARDAIELRLMNVETLLARSDVSSAAKTLRSVYAALSEHPDRHLSQRAVLNAAKVSFFAGHHEHAYRLARELACAITPADAVWGQTHGLIGRIAAFEGRHWECPTQRATSEWDTLYLRAARSRHALRSGQYSEAQIEAHTVFEAARARGFLPIAAYAASTLAMCYATLAPGSRDEWAICALQMLTSCGTSIEVGYDLFRVGALTNSITWLNDAPKTQLAKIYFCLQPTSFLASTPEYLPFVEDLVHSIVRQAAGGSRLDNAVLEGLVESAWDAARSLDNPAPIARELQTLTELGEFLKVLWPLDQVPRYAALFSSSARITIRAITRALTHRQIRALSYVS